MVFICTAITFNGRQRYFGRNLDLEYVYGENVVVTPRNFPLEFRFIETLKSHYAMIGMALVKNDYPLYFDAMNEYGVCMAGLNFVGNAKYSPPTHNKINITHFELIPYLLGLCKTADEALEKLKEINLTNTQFSEELEVSQLHWLLSDREKSYTLEWTENGGRFYENPYGVLTNNPPFDFHLENLKSYINLTTEPPSCNFSKSVEITANSKGAGAQGLPGDWTSQSRFIRATFVKLNSNTKNTNDREQFFRILDSVAMPDGCVVTADGCARTQYTSCCDMNDCVYHFCTYDNRTIRSIALRDFDVNSTALGISSDKGKSHS